MQIVSAGADTAGHEKRSLLEAYASAMHADAWAALALWITAAIAGGALLFASLQVNEARATRKAVAQPNVVVYVDLNPGDWQYLDLVVKNFGQTPAYGIRFVGLPDLDVVPWENLLTGDHETALHVPETIVVLASGQEWRTIWDSAIAREDYEADRQLHPDRRLRQLRTVFCGEVIFLDGQDERYENPIRLDTNTFRDMQRLRGH